MNVGVENAISGQTTALSLVITGGNTILVSIEAAITSGNASIARPTIPKVQNTTMTSASTEYTATLAGTIKRFTVRGMSADIKLCFSAGASGLTYLTIPKADAYDSGDISVLNPILYVQSLSATDVAQILFWT